MNEYESIREQELRRRKMIDIMTQKAMQPGGVYNVSGRTVPYSPVEGLSQLGQAYFLRKAREESDKRIEEARQRQTEKSGAATQRVLDLMQGRSPYELGENETFDDEQIPGLYSQGAPDPQAAMLAASTDPDIQSPNLAKVISAMSGRGDYYTPEDVVMPDGSVRKMVFDRRRNKWSVPDIPGYEGPVSSPRYDPDTQGQISESKASGKITGESIAQAAIDLPKTEAASDETISLVDDLLNHPGMKDVVGLPDNPFYMKGFVPGTPAADFRARLKQLTGRTFMEVFPTLKGGGQITEIEGEKAQQAINRMSSAVSEKEFIKAAEDFKQEILRLKALVRKRAGVEETTNETTTWSEDKERRYQEYKSRMLK